MTIPSRLVSAVKTRSLAVFVGAGLSKQSDPKHFPSWAELLRRMLAEGAIAGHLSIPFKKDVEELIARDRLLMAAEALRAALPIDFYQAYLERGFDPPHVLPSEAHRLLFALQPRFLITTNYDRLLEDTYAERNKKSLTVIPYSNAEAVQRRLQDDRLPDRPFLFKIHGDIEDVRSIILTESDYRKLLFDEHGYQIVLSTIFIHYVVLFVGFSLGDAELNLLLTQIRHSLKAGNQPDYVLLADNSLNNVEIARFRNDYGLEVITYPYDSTHSGLRVFLEALHASTKPAS